MTFYVTHDLSFDVIFEKSLKMMMMMMMKDKSKKRELDVLALKNVRYIYPKPGNQKSLTCLVKKCVI